MGFRRFYKRGNKLSEENKDPLYGKPWTIFKKCKTYEQAYAEVQQILNSDQKYQTKIRRRADDTFVVKTRSLEVPVSKNGKRKRKSK
tara:strand:+ start:870 stop:1130 length:261 start_codon:yes stop_codon:yes gene_type:complete